jgi:hypothetical protein
MKPPANMQEAVWKHRDDIAQIEWERGSQPYPLSRVVDHKPLISSQQWGFLKKLSIILIATGIGWMIVAMIGYALWHLPKWLHI